jgi:hypothetical protein
MDQKPSSSSTENNVDSFSFLSTRKHLVYELSGTAISWRGNSGAGQEGSKEE